MNKNDIIKKLEIPKGLKYKEVYDENLKRTVLMVYSKTAGKWVHSAGERMNDYSLLAAATPVTQDNPAL